MFRKMRFETFARAIVRSRLAHFCVLGAVVFAIAPREGGRRIELRSQTLAALHEADLRKNDAPIDLVRRAREIDGRAIEDELLYREALRMALDKGDPIVKQRLVEKLLLLVEDLGGAGRAPTDAELRAYFEATRAERRAPALVRFVHVYASKKDALPPREALDPSAREAPALGEAFAYPRLVTASGEEIQRVYGPDIAKALADKSDGWSDAVASPFGWHRVHLVENLGSASTFEAMKSEIALDFELARRERIVGAYLVDLAAQYEVRIDGRRLKGFVPPRRVAVRADPSAED
jgi:peptidyl-prolyl cis-trans isomerase C